MAIEPRRGCGYRKVGGTYLVGGGVGVPCDRLPITLTVCPTCNCGIKQSRGWTWIDVNGLVGGIHADCKDQFPCPLCMATAEMGKAGLLWIGEKYYKTPEDFHREGTELGFSRRVSAIPRNFKVGETWVLLAHAKGATCSHCKGAGIWKEGTETVHCKVCKQTGRVPGIFKVWRPSRIEKICLESERGSEEVAELEKRGITPVFVPDNDKDHNPSGLGSFEDDEEVGEVADADSSATA